MKILIADNDFESMEDISIALNLCIPELELIITNSGKQSLWIIKDRSPDIVILGLQLSEMFCFDVISQIRSFSNVPIIVVSYKDNGNEVVRVLEMGANDYIVKPIKSLELIARLRKLVQKHNSEGIKTKGPINKNSRYKETDRN